MPSSGALVTMFALAMMVAPDDLTQNRSSTFTTSENKQKKAHVPILSAPALNISTHASNVLTPPEAFTFTLSSRSPQVRFPTATLINQTSSLVAPPPLKPVHVLTNAAPASVASSQAVIFSCDVERRAVSMITLTGYGWQAVVIVLRW